MAEDPNLISIAPQPEEETPIVLTDGTERTPVSPEVAGERAYKAKYGLAVMDKSWDDLQKQIQAGDEADLRRKAALDLDYRKSVAASNFLGDVARKRNRPLTDEEATTLAAIFKEATVAQDPQSVFEDLYAGEYMKSMDKMRTNNESSFLNEAAAVDPKRYEAIKSAGREVISKNEFINTKIQDLQEVIKQQSWLGWGADIAKSMVPLYTTIKLAGRVPGTSKFGLLGNTLEEQALDLLRRPYPEFKTMLTDILNTLQKDNPSAALEFLHAVQGQSTSEKALNNAFSLIDIATLPIVGTGRVVGRVTGLLKDTEKVAKDVAASAKIAGTDPSIPIAAAGDIGEAAVQKVSSRLLKNIHRESIPTQEAIDVLPSVLKDQTEAIRANPGRFGTGLINQIEERNLQISSGFLKVLGETSKVERLPELASTEYIRMLKDSIPQDYPGIHNKIMDLSIFREPISNSHFYEMIVGQNNGQFFMNKTTAENFRKMFLPQANAVVDNQGSGAGWYIRITKPIDETSNVVRNIMNDALVNASDAKSPSSWFNAWFGKLRTPEETLSEANRSNRHTATYAPSNLRKIVEDSVKEIKAIAGINYLKDKERWNNWIRTVEYAKDAVHPDTGAKGYFFRSPQELEDHWLRNFNTLPDEKAIKAYFAMVRTLDLDYALRNRALYANKARVGAQQHRFSMIDPTTNKPFYSEYIEGMVKKNFPGGEDTILVLGKRAGEEKLYRAGSYNPQVVKKLNEDIKTGALKVIEIYDPDQLMLNQFSKVANAKNARVRYVITPTIETKPLSWHQIPYKAGGHFELDYTHYVKQADIITERVGKNVRHIYRGDKTIMPVALQSMGADIAKKLDQVRIYIKNKDFASAKAYTEKYLPHDWKEVRSWFLPKKDPEGNIVPPMLSKDYPIRVVKAGATINSQSKELENMFRTGKDKLKPTLVDGTRSGSAAKAFQVQFTSERDAFDMFTYNDVGTKGNPIYNIAPVKYVDPMTSMNRALARIINSTYLDDYKIFSVERWIREAAPHLNPSEADLRASPMFHFNNPDWKAHTDPKIKSELTTRKMQIEQLVGVPSKTDTMLQSMAQKLADSIYHTLGPAEQYSKPVQAMLLTPSWLIPKLKDPFGFVRSMTFHAKLGLFSIPQILVQSQTFVTIAGVAGMSKAAPGTVGALLHQWSRLNKNPAILDTLDNLATKMRLPGMSRWKPGEWKEAMQELDKTGFGNVAGEYAVLDTQLSHKVFQSKGKDILDGATFFFTEGERGVRYGAWYTAYREFRDNVKAVGRITEADRKWILDRADLLNVNMSRASSSLLHTGVASLPTQFLSYQIRAFELFTGKRLTWQERARLLATYGAVYGAPVTVAATGLPLVDQIRTEAMKRGYIPGENTTVSTLMEGVPALMLALISGEGEPTKGTWYNIQERYGPQGFEPIREAMRGDKTIWDILGGAAYSTMANTIASSDGLFAAMLSGIRNDGVYPVTVDDYVDIFKEISSVNNTTRLVFALNFGKNISKKETYLSDVTQGNAIFQYLTGLQDTKVSDLNLLSVDHKAMKAAEKMATDNFVQEFRRASIAGRDENWEQHRKYMTRAFAWLDGGDVPQERRGGIIRTAIQENMSLVNRMDWDYFMKNVPSKYKEQFRDIYTRRLQLQRERGER